MFPDGGGEPVAVATRTVLRTDHVETLLHAAIAGAGIASLPRLLAATPIAQGALVPLLEPWRTGTFPVWAALPSRQFMPRRARAFLDFVVAGLDAALSRPPAAG
jgi:DNA-binding transcriptional LysR family regulator